MKGHIIVRKQLLTKDTSITFVTQQLMKNSQNDQILIDENCNSIHRNGKSNYNVTNENPPVNHGNGDSLLLKKNVK